MRSLRLIQAMFFLSLFLAAFSAGKVIYAQDKALGSFDQEIPVDITADSLSHDEKTRVVTASGDVEIVQGKRTLRADKVIYDLEADIVTASGNVILHEPNGDVHFADELRLSDGMSSGVVTSLLSYLSDGGKFTAGRGERLNETYTVMYDAAYTPCDCEKNDDGAPAWQIRAKELHYDEEQHKLTYKNAWFEIFGIPTAWTPYLTHSDGKVKRKSGLLAPKFGYDSQLGFVIEPEYYIALAEDKDVTVGTKLMTKELPLLMAEYRQRFKSAYLKMRGSLSYSGRRDKVNGQSIARDEEIRGHLFTDARWDINNKWRSGVNLELTSDDQYLRQFDISNKDLLENEIYLERFSGRNYARMEGIVFQDTRVSRVDDDQPGILPGLTASFLGEPQSFLGGRWSFDASGLQLVRENGQDVSRAILEAGWQRRLVSDYGLVTTVDATARGDAYYVQDRDTPTGTDEGSSLRWLTRMHAVSSYPVVKSFDRVQAVIEPVAALTVSPNINSADNDIPNEDSLDVQLDAINLFEPDRFPGKDRIEDGSHVTYGMRTGIYGYEGSFADVFVGQSYRLDEDDNPFAADSGLSRQQSDLVGVVSAYYLNKYGLNYRFQLDSADLSSQRHELDAYARWDRFSLGSRYLFAKRLSTSTTEDSREQLYANAAYKLTSKWRVRTSGLYDLGEDPGLRNAALGFDYYGCCLTFSVTANRNLTSDTSGESDTDITFRIGLKGIGEFTSAETAF